MSYPAQFNTSGRIHSVKEAVDYTFNGKESTVELFLFMLDTYDVLLDIASGGISFPTGRETWNHDLLNKLYLKMRKILVNRWEHLNEFIPGRLKGWTQGLFWYVEMMLIRYIMLTSPNMLIINEKIKTWIKTNYIQSNDSFNLNTWSFMDVVRALELLEARMNDLPWTEEIFEYLDIIEYRCAEFCTLNYNFSVLDRAKHRIEISKTVYQLHPTGIHELMTRCTLIRRAAELWFAWDSEPAPNITEHYFDNFIEKEKRQLTQRKFRDELNNRALENMLRPSERTIQSYRLRGADVSDYGALAVNRPLYMLDVLGKQCSYAKFEELMDDFRIPDVMYMGMVHMHVSSIYNLQFLKYFYLSEKHIHKHKHKVHLVLAPFIIQRSNRYDCMWRGNIVPSRDGSFYWAFLTWITLIRKKCGGIVYGGVNLIPLAQLILDKPKVIAARKTTGTLDYHWV
jgi:hypothetical protein